jgi:hypothetical protein
MTMAGALHTPVRCDDSTVAVCSSAILPVIAITIFADVHLCRVKLAPRDVWCHLLQRYLLIVVC